MGLDNYIRDPSTRPLVASIASVDATTRYDFVFGSDGMDPVETKAVFVKHMTQVAKYHRIVAHNAGFERAVLQLMGAGIPSRLLIDSAVIARGVGAGSRLESAAPQLLDADKMVEGARLIQKFSVPQEDGRILVEDPESWSDEDYDDWETFGLYCDLDAELSLGIAQAYSDFPSQEWEYEHLTHLMNQRGWPVDLDLVQVMHETYLRNREEVEAAFREEFDGDKPLNFRSTPQLREWCLERGLRVKSFDELSVAKLLPRVQERMVKLRASPSVSPSDPRHRNLYEVEQMLLTKKELGGSSLSKLERITELVGPDSRLRDQYLHVGAGQSFRTSGRGVQMQNLKRLGASPDDVEGDVSRWSNDMLARNLRQVFRAEHEFGALVVGDFSAVESRGLAYLAGAEWKLDAFREGKDLYKVLAASMLGTSYERVDKAQRQTGKVGELSCGYGAGPKAVRSFAEKMGVAFTEEEAAEVVFGWRDSNPEIVELWEKLNTALHDVVADGFASRQVTLGTSEDPLVLELAHAETPRSLIRQMPTARTVKMTLFRSRSGRPILVRWFQGAFMDGRDVCYHKPSELKSGKLWLDRWTKDGQSGRYKLYGGKLAGILTQSFCRELFFAAALELEKHLGSVPNAQLIGQFHDELVVEWWPSSDPRGLDLSDVVQLMWGSMSHSTIVPGFPLSAEVNFDRRYIK